jgi:polyhydroxyalkanoate synthesis regulator phasin
MSAEEPRSEKGGVADSLRGAVERTLAATAGTAVETRERAQELLDEVARRGLEARGEVSRRGQEARDEVSRRGQRTREGLARMRLASADEVGALAARVDELEARMERLETAERTSGRDPDPKVED